jgi:hypothetical protein
LTRIQETITIVIVIDATTKAVSQEVRIATWQKEERRCPGLISPYDVAHSPKMFSTP